MARSLLALTVAGLAACGGDARIAATAANTPGAGESDAGAPTGGGPASTPGTPATPASPTPGGADGGSGSGSTGGSGSGSPAPTPPQSPQPPATCGAGEQLCSSTCVDPGTDASNCGACGNACPGGQTCAQGHCTPSCPAGQTCCSASIYDWRPAGCYDLLGTYDACGTCDAMPCRQSWDGSSHQPGYCDQGVCAKAPPVCSTPGLTWCSPSGTYLGRRMPDGACVDLTTNVENCGTCDNWCNSPALGIGSCVGGACVWN